jgi:hypothetical protein
MFSILFPQDKMKWDYLCQMEQLHILRCAFSANAKISFVSKLVCVAYSVLWENQLLLGKKIVFLSMTLIFPPFLPNS